MIKINTDRLILRTFCEKDSQRYLELYKNVQVHCFADKKIDDIDMAKQEVLQMNKLSDGSSLAVCLKETDEMIGMVFGSWEGDTFGICWNFLTDSCGQGFGYEAAKAYITFLFEKMHARRIYAYVEDDNLSSQRLCEKLLMRREGLFKEFITFINDDEGKPIYENTYVYAVLKKEWHQDKK